MYFVNFEVRVRCHKKLTFAISSDEFLVFKVEIVGLRLKLSYLSKDLSLDISVHLSFLS